MAARYISEIRVLQPTGPYLVVGECLGGGLAYELARQLRALGADVALLVLIDAFPSGLPRLRDGVSVRRYKAMHRARILWFHLGNVTRMGPGEQWTYVMSRLKRTSGALRLRAGSVQGKSPFALAAQRSFAEASATYSPAPYQGKAVVLRASSLPRGIEPARDLGWAQYVADLAIDEVPGYFTTLLSEPCVTLLAAKLRERIGDALRA